MKISRTVSGKKSLKVSPKAVLFFIFPSLIAFTAFTSCSLKYGNEEETEVTTPEFVFTDAVFSRYENNSISLQLTATTLEQYKKDSSSYAENAKFKTWNKDGELDTEGNCRLLSLDTKNDFYSLYKDISVNNLSNNFYILAQNLKYDGTTQQLTSGQEDSVYIQRDDVEITGTGFSASGVSRSYSFTGAVQGSITTSEGEAVTSAEDTLTQEESQNQNINDENQQPAENSSN